MLVYNQPNWIWDLPPGGTLGLNIPEAFLLKSGFSLPNTTLSRWPCLGSNDGSFELSYSHFFFLAFILMFYSSLENFSWSMKLLSLWYFKTIFYIFFTWGIRADILFLCFGWSFPSKRPVWLFIMPITCLWSWWCNFLSWWDHSLSHGRIINCYIKLVANQIYIY